MERLRDDDRDSLRVLLERYWLPLVAYSACIVGGREAANDVVQDVFIRLWQRRAEWSPGGSVGAYIYRIARNLSLNARRDRNTQAKREQEGGLRLAGSASANARSPYEELLATSLRQEVEAAIDALPERRREVFILSRFHGLGHQEIAHTLGISPQTVANQMSAALSNLRARLAPHRSNHDVPLRSESVMPGNPPQLPSSHS